MEDSTTETGPAPKGALTGTDRHGPTPVEADAPEAPTTDVDGPEHLKHDDPSQSSTRNRPTAPGRHGVSWVRAGDLLSHGTGKAAGRGITWTTTANRWSQPRPLQVRTSRRGIDRATSAPSDRASRLAPVSAFGTRRQGAARQGVSR